MAKSKWVIGVLAALLVGTNAWWAFSALDAGVTRTYADVTLADNKQALAQALAVIETGRADATRDSIARAARAAGGDPEPFEKDGYTWVGSIGLQFDADGQLVGAARAWDPQ